MMRSDHSAGHAVKIPASQPEPRSLAKAKTVSVAAKRPSKRSSRKSVDDRAVTGASHRATDEASVGVGARLRYLREAYGLSMRELARKSGLNHGTIGCIEKETISPSVGSLRKILDSFPITLSEFFALDLKAESQVFFAKNELLEVGGNGVSLKQVGRNLMARPLQVLLEHYLPGAETAAAPYSHSGEEGGVVVQGSIELTVGNHTRVLGPGEAYLFPSRLPHRFRNAGTEECVIVSANTPPV